jgi:hypothetical protein
LSKADITTALSECPLSGVKRTLIQPSKDGTLRGTKSFSWRAASLKADIVRWSAVIKSLGIKLD